MVTQKALASLNKSCDEPRVGIHLQSSPVFDTYAGSNVFSALEQSLHDNAQSQLEKVVEIVDKKRQRSQRKRQLGGPAEGRFQKGGFSMVGEIEPDNEDRASDNKYITQTESLANSSVYHMLENCKSLEKFYSQTVERKTEGDTTKDQETPVSKKLLTLEETDLLNAEHSKHLDDPLQHFKKIKAKINLNAHKKYQEDVIREEEERQKEEEQAIVIKDNLGRVMEKKNLKMQTKRIPNTNRHPRKRPKLKKKRSFYTDLKTYNDIEKGYNPMDKINEGGPTLIDIITIKRMKEYQRWPIPEMLMNRPLLGNFCLKIDTILADHYKEDEMKEWAEWRPLVDAPYNSVDSDDNFNLYHSSDDEVEHKKALQQVEIMEGKHSIKFDLGLLDVSPFRMESMKFYPYKSKEGEIPLKLLKVPNFEFLFQSSPLILEQQNEENGGIWDMRIYQYIFEHYCTMNKSAVIPIEPFFDTADPDNVKFSVKNFRLDENTVKSMVCLIPFLVDVVEVEFRNNQITDNVAGALAMACFANPKVSRLTIAYNYLRSSFSKTLCSMIKLVPLKLHYLNLMGSASDPLTIMPLARHLESMKMLKSLDLSGNGMNQQICRILNNFIIHSIQLRQLNLSHCKLTHQSTRYIIDAMNRNTTIRNFNFSHNDLSSASFEYSVKIASMIARHPTLSHMNITGTNLKREEILFVGISLSTSKTMLSLHLTGILPYYERIFLRSVIAARVSYTYRHLTGRKAIRSNREKNILHLMAGRDGQEKELQTYIDQMRDLDERRQGLDFDIQDILEDLDTQASFEGVDPSVANQSAFAPDSKVGILIAKMVERQKEIENQKEQLMTAYGSIKSQNQERLLGDASELSKLNAQEFGKILKAKEIKTESAEDAFGKQNQLKVERERQRAEQKVSKEHNDRSAGELALMFMGINQVAYELLVENPMTGYMNEIIFTRILGHEDIEQAAYWNDGTQCWLCQKWNKATISYDLNEDKQLFHKKVVQFDTLHHNINQSVEKALKGENEMEIINLRELRNDPEVDSDYIAEVPEEMEVTTRFKSTIGKNQTGFRSGMKMTGLMKTLKSSIKYSSNHDVHAGQTHQDFCNTIEHTENEKKIEELKEESIVEHEAETEGNVENESSSNKDSLEETSLEEVDQPHHKKFDNTNPMQPVKKPNNMLKRQVLPLAVEDMEEFVEMQLRDTYQDLDFKNLSLKRKLGSAYGNRKHNVNVKQLGGISGLGGGSPRAQQPATALDQVANIQKQFLAIRDGSSTGGELPHHYQSSVISTHELKRERGQPLLIQRQIFFDGMVYMIEEEIYSDADHSSVYTSEDSFEEDNGLQKELGTQNPIINRNSENTPSVMNSIQSVNGFIEHRDNIQNMLTKIIDSRPESQRQTTDFVDSPSPHFKPLTGDGNRDLKIDLKNVNQQNDDQMAYEAGDESPEVPTPAGTSPRMTTGDRSPKSIKSVKFQNDEDKPPTGVTVKSSMAKDQSERSPTNAQTKTSKDKGDTNRSVKGARITWDQIEVDKTPKDRSESIDSTPKKATAEETLGEIGQRARAVSLIVQRPANATGDNSRENVTPMFVKEGDLTPIGQLSTWKQGDSERSPKVVDAEAQAQFDEAPKSLGGTAGTVKSKFPPAASTRSLLDNVKTPKASLSKKPSLMFLGESTRDLNDKSPTAASGTKSGGRSPRAAESKAKSGERSPKAESKAKSGERSPTAAGSKAKSGERSPTAAGSKAKSGERSPAAADSKKKEEKVETEAPDKKGKKGKTVRKQAAKRAPKKRDYFTNTPGLTEEQKEYEIKAWPRHFITQVAEKRVVRFLDQQEKEAQALANEAAGIPQEEAVVEVDPIKALEKIQKFPAIGEESTAVGSRALSTGAGSTIIEKKKINRELYCVASFNDWFPTRMKTARALGLEKYQLDDEDIPNETFMRDNIMSIYSNFIPPGQHFFYLCHEQGDMFLSPKHEVIRFKSSNVFLNRIIVKPRLEDNLESVFAAKGMREEEAQFLKDRSVFADYMEDDDQFLRKCFDQDIEYAKIERLFKRNPEYFENVKECLFSHYVQMINIFDYYSGISDYPRISMMDMTSFAHHTEILDNKYIGLAALDLLLVATNVSTHKYKQSAERDMCRYELLEFFVRTANFRYLEKKIASDSVEAIEMLLEEYVYPRARFMNGEHFRRYFCYNMKTNDLIKNNAVPIEKLYMSFTHSKKKWITLPEAKEFVRKLELKCSELMVGAMYAESMMTIIDTMSDPTRPQQMKYVEFLVFLCRITKEHYESTEHKAEAFFKKLDHMMPRFLDYVGLKCVFQYEELFATEIKDQYRKFIRKKKQFNKAERKAAAAGEELDPKIIAEFKNYEKSVKQMGINTDVIITSTHKGKESESEDEPEEREKKKFLTVKEIIESSAGENLLSIKNFRTKIDDEDRELIDGVDVEEEKTKEQSAITARIKAAAIKIAEEAHATKQAEITQGADQNSPDKPKEK